MSKFWIAFVVALVSLYLLFAPVAVSPVAWQAPKDAGYTGVFAQNNQLTPLEPIEIGDESGPEDLALDSKGNMYASAHSGGILRMLKGDKIFRPWINTGGRPLGIEMDKQDRLWIADAYLGLLRADTTGHIEVMTDAVNGSAIRYADDVDIAPDGRVYFSDASSKFGAKAHGGTLAASLLDLMEHGGHGRLLCFDPVTEKTTVLLEGLQFANGIALEQNGGFVLVNETGHYRVIKYWLQGPKAGTHEVITENLPGFPDNIARTTQGDFWLGLASPRSGALDALSNSPWLRTVVQRLPAFMRPQAKDYGHLVKINGTGDVLLSLQDPSGLMPMTTGAIEYQGKLYVSSLTADYVGVLPLP